MTELFSKSGEPLSKVTDEHLGVWIEGASVRNPIEFSISIVELAMLHGMPVEVDQWHKDRPLFLNGEYDFGMLEDLSYTTDAALEHLNSQLPENYFFDFDDGLCLFRDGDPE